MTERELSLLREARAFEKRIHADPHSRHPARGNDMQQVRRRAKRRFSNQGLRRLVQDWR